MRPTAFLACLALACTLLAGCRSTRAGPEGTGEDRDRPQATSRDFAPGELLVRFRAGTTDARREVLLSAVGGVVLEAYTLVPDLYHVQVSLDPEDAVRRLERAPEVLYAHPNYRLRGTAQKVPTDADFPLQWGLWVDTTPQVPLPIEGSDDGLPNWFQPNPLADIEAPHAWSVHTGSGGFVVAVIDSGLVVAAGEFVGNLAQDASGHVGWDFLANKPVTNDGSGHGTRIASIIGARANDGLGDSVVGVNWSCKLLPLRFIGKSPSTDGVLVDTGTTANAIKAIQYATNLGVKVSNNSYGAQKIADATGLRDAIDQAGQAGMLFVASAGNMGVDLNVEPFYPAAFDLDNILAVTSIDYDDKLPSDVGYGLGVVDIAAPGVEIYARGKYGYGFDDGTSYATAFVSGAAALFWDLHPKLDHQAVKSRILSSARVNQGLKGKIEGGRVLHLANLLQNVLVVDVDALRRPPYDFDDTFRGGLELHLTPEQDPRLWQVDPDAPVVAPPLDPGPR